LNTADLKNGLLLGASTSAAILVIVAVFALTRERIRTTEQLNLQTDLEQLLVPGSFNNEPALDKIYLRNRALGDLQPKAIYRARNNGKPTGVVITSLAPDGYNGDIELLVGLRYDGTINGVRVTKHSETPGLGDDIELSRSDWIKSFNNLSTQQIKPQQWNVKKDGGRFDQFTGATITPRAIVSSVHQVILWFQHSRDTIFAPLPTN